MTTPAMLDSAMAGLRSAQAGILTTSQNVAGANVDGYVRRSPSVKVHGLAPTNVDLTGTSFAVEGFSRFFDAQLQTQLLGQQGRSAYTKELTQFVSTLDTMLIDPSTSVASALGIFLNSAGSLANDPANPAYQQTLLGAATQLTDRVRGLATEVDRIGRNAGQALADVLNQANVLLPQLATINTRIKNAAIPGQSYPSPDLLDERDRLTSTLHELVGGTTRIDSDGTASFLVNGQALVDHSSASLFVNRSGASPLSPLTLLEDVRIKLASPAGGPIITIPVVSPSVLARNSDGTLQVTANGNSVVLPGHSLLEDGKAGAYVTLMRDFVPTMQMRLNAFAASVVREVNETRNANGQSIGAIFGFGSSAAGGAALTGANPQQWTALDDLFISRQNTLTGQVSSAINAGQTSLTLTAAVADLSKGMTAYFVDSQGSKQKIGVVESVTGTTVNLSFGSNLNVPANTQIKFARELSYAEVAAAMTVGSTTYDADVAKAASDRALSATALSTVATYPAYFLTGAIDGSAARALEGLRGSLTSPVAMLTTSTATTIADWRGQEAANETLLNSLKSQKETISGVNLDEEAANLVKYQQIYNASSKIMQSARQMFDTLLTMLST